MILTNNPIRDEWQTITLGDDLDFEGDLSLIVEEEDQFTEIWLTRTGRNHLRAHLAKIDDVEESLPSFTPSGESFNADAIALAIAYDREISFQYQKASGPGGVIERRTLAPSSLMEVKDHQLVVGFDMDRESPRAYRLDRILGSVTVSG